MTKLCPYCSCDNIYKINNEVKLSGVNNKSESTINVDGFLLCGNCKSIIPLNEDVEINPMDNSRVKNKILLELCRH